MNDTSADALMATDLACVDLSDEFEKIVELRQSLAEETRELDKEITLLQEKRAEIAEPYETGIKEHEESIKQEILARGKAFHCTYGKAIFKRGSRKIEWNDDALIGYAVEHPEIKQFRSESVGKSSVVLKVGEQK